MEKITMMMAPPAIPKPIVTYALFQNGVIVGFTNYLHFAEYFTKLRDTRSYTITEYYEFH